MSEDGRHYLPLVELKEIFTTKTEYKVLSDLFGDKLAAAESELKEELQQNREATRDLKTVLDQLQQERERLQQEREALEKKRAKRLNFIVALVGAVSVLIGQLLSRFVFR